MTAHGRADTLFRCVRTLTLVLLAAASAPAAPPAPGMLPAETGSAAADRMCSDAMRADARLADVAFIDPLHGWAVGDRGTIWHTDDGGRHWHLQNSGVACRLESVQFLDDQTGWAAGGFSQPYTHAGKGVLLLTRDGGRHWAPMPGLLLPALKKVRFFDRQHGWAAGCPSALFSSGAFVTDDGGRSWNPMSGAQITAWQSGDFLDRNTGVLAGFDGTAAKVRRGGVEPARTSRFGLRRIGDIQLVPEVQPQVYGWLVGQGGLVMMTSDLGSTWHTPPVELPPGVAVQFDFAAIEVRGPKAWIAGSPGARILYTSDAGRSWAALSTSQSLPIEALTFVDDRHGWAVGYLGTILATSDGGMTWTRQHSGGSRAALLGLFNEPKDIPLELLAQLAGDEGYLAAIELTGRRDASETPPQAEVPLDDRMQEAVVAVGASAARLSWQFPLRQPGLKLGAEAVVDTWNRANDGRALETLEAHLVRQIRLWRPDVVLTHAAVLAADDSAATLVHQAVLRAVAAAEDPTAYAEQLTVAGLEPWKVKRVAGSLGPDTRGTVTLATTQLSARLGSTLADVAGPPRALVGDGFQTPPESLGFQILLDASTRSSRAATSPRSPASERGDLFAGIALAPGGDARRMLAEPAADTVDMIRRIAQKRRNTEAILQRSARDPQHGPALLAQLGELTGGLDSHSAGDVLYELGQRYYQTGKWPLAAETFSRLAERYPDHPLTEAALQWLVQYYASGEAAWRVQQAGRMPDGVSQSSYMSLSLSSTSPSPPTARLDRAAAVGHQIETTRPELYARPQLGFPLAVVAQARGFRGDAERFYLVRRRSGTHDAWWACAQGEQWLETGGSGPPPDAAAERPGEGSDEGLPPKPVLWCVAAGPSEKPHLDGRLDDAIWQKAKTATLDNREHVPASAGPASVMLAHDAQFLYLAVRCPLSPVPCPQPPGASSDKPRRRDGDLSDHDRVDVMLDVDRDFVTYYRFAVDHRGWPNDACWGDLTWDPTWFVAAGSDAGQRAWTAEAAIPLDQLSGASPTRGAVWAIGIQRVVPGVGFQSWNTPASTEVIPQGFGYLLFQ